ncbi:MAG: KpsF/GutQ family sugar-phosphate isomerase [Thermodesulfobacteriota bacterium]
MVDKGSAIEAAKRVLKIEGDALYALMDKIGDSFEKAVDLILQCKGKVVVTGIGKSGLICKKIASTLTSTGTPALFLHPTEGIHGDLGVLVKTDIVVAVSNSGETDELSKIIPLVKRMGIKLISVTGNTASTLARAGDVVLDIGVKEEACPLGLAPTASTTSTLAMGDALAVALLEKRGFTKEDFAFVHPGGAIGRKLILLVQELMHVGDRIPLVKEDTLMKEAIFEITSKGLGVTGVVDGLGKLTGIITDGDLRRALETDDNIMTKQVKDVMSAQPKIIEINDLAAKALQIMESFSITSLFVHNGVEKMKPVGIIHIHDLLKAGVA